MNKEKIERINELSKKKKSSGLTAAEQIEQKALYQEYLGLMRKNMKAQLDNMVIDHPDGTSTEVKNLKKTELKE